MSFLFFFLAFGGIIILAAFFTSGPCKSVKVFPARGECFGDGHTKLTFKFTKDRMKAERMLIDQSGESYVFCPQKHTLNHMVLCDASGGILYTLKAEEDCRCLRLWLKTGEAQKVRRVVFTFNAYTAKGQQYTHICIVA